MNKKQAMRIALAVEASYILFGASTDGVTDLLSEADNRRYSKAQNDLGWKLLHKAGFDEPMNAPDIIDVVLNQGG